MLVRIWALILFLSCSAFGQNWNPKLAATYLDSRQEKWAAWPPAKSADGPCVSCHTGLTYLLARPALREILNEKAPTEYETGLMRRLRSNVGNKPAAPLRDVEVIFTALFLAREDASKGALSSEAQRALDQLWQLQTLDGAAKGGWKWYNADLDPWETPDSPYYGSALAALAVGSAPAGYRTQPQLQERIAALRQYFQTGYAAQPMQNRLALLWASSRLPALMPVEQRKILIKEVLDAQRTDGAWTLQSLGPWKHSVSDKEGSTYATGYVAYVLLQSGLSASDSSMRRALQWLRSNQDAQTGTWSARSMNKERPAESMEALFMQDAATAFASMALAYAK